MRATRHHFILVFYDPVDEYLSFTSIFEAVEVVENNEGTVFRPNPNPNKPDL